MNFKIIIKAAVIGVLLLLMLIPLGFVKGTVSGRLNYKEEAEKKITKAWGEELFIAAPLLNIPYRKSVTKKIDGKEVVDYQTDYLKYTPALVEADVEIVPQVRAIGIFKVPVFTAKVKMKGNFAKPGNEHIVSPKAFVTLEMNSLKGISSTPVLNWGGKNTAFENALEGTPLTASVPRTVQTKGRYSEQAYYERSYDERLKMLAAPAPSSDKKMDFELSFEVRGSNAISFIPVGSDNKFVMHSTWASPNFIGSFLPDTREVSDSGFRASWNVNSLSSGVPAQISTARDNFPLMSVSLMFPVDNYRNSERAIKYGILFIALTFLACFVFEVVSKTPVHPFQYMLVGVAMAVFYLLLVALSEFMAFSISYTVAAAATIALVTAYIRWGILRHKSKKILWAGCALAALYAYLYVLLQLEDLSLIFGTIGLFFGLAVVMYATRNINWYE